MASLRRILERILRATSDRNVRFADLIRLLQALGFGERIKGDHHIFFREGVDEIINLQPLSNGKAKAYQVKQVRGIVTRYRLMLPE